MEFSPPAWIGALAGTIVAVAIYIPAIRVIERYLRTQHGPMSPEERRVFEERLSVVRRVILGTGITILAVAGYLIGNAIGGMRG